MKILLTNDFTGLVTTCYLDTGWYPKKRLRGIRAKLCASDCRSGDDFGRRGPQFGPQPEIVEQSHERGIGIMYRIEILD